MPGFRINSIGGNDNYANASTKYYYTYTWEILNILSSVEADNKYLVNARDMSLPTFNVSKEMIQGSSLEYKYAKSVTWDDVRITWYDTVGFINIIKQWRDSVWTEQTGLQPASYYKRQSVLSYYTPDRLDNEGTIIYKLYNSWPSIIKHGDLTYTSSDAKVVEVTLTYDWAEENNL